MNNKLNNGPLLDKDGNLSECGYATSLVKEYDRKAIKGLKWRIKEWDYYAILTPHYAIALTIADNSYMSLVSASFLDFDNKAYITKSYMRWLTFGKVGFPSTSVTGDVLYEKKGYDFKFYNDSGKRKLVCTYPKFDGDLPLTCEISLEPTNKDSMVIATPFNKKGHFYYNQKINCLQASGWFKIGDKEYSLDDAVGVLDWGRGTWTYKNTWYWSSLNIKKDGKYYGFNLGYGFGDTSAASENMLFIDNESEKLDDVEFIIPKKEDGTFDYEATWEFKSKSGNINMTFTPVLDRHDDTNALIISTFQHQVFGKFNGTITVNGKTQVFNDDLGFAEHVRNKW